MKAADVWYLAKQTGQEFWADNGPRLGAALAYYIALSLSPLLLVVVSLTGIAFSEQAARGEIAFLLLASLMFAAVRSGIDPWLQAHVPWGRFWLKAGNQVLSFVLAAALFAMIFKVLPHSNPSWRAVRAGALLTAVLFTLGKY